MLIAAKIHNNSLGQIIEIASFEEGIKLIIKWAEDQLDRDLSPEELEDLNNTYEISDFSDSDNHFTWSLGEVER